MLAPNPSQVTSFMKNPSICDMAITQNGYVGQITSIDQNSRTKKINCTIPNKEIDAQIRNIVAADSSNYLTEEQLAQQVGISQEAVHFIASRLIPMPDDSNIAINKTSISCSRKLLFQLQRSTSISRR